MRIAVLEDETKDREHLLSLISLYEKEKGIKIEISCFENGLELIEKYAGGFDLIFLDIMTPVMNGMEAARKIREKDDQVLIIFITSLAQMALEGYKVEALDFVVKPIEYDEFNLKMARVLKRLKKEDDAFILITKGGQKIKLMAKDILYVESLSHRAIFHTVEEEIEVYDSLRKIATKLGKNFVFCNSCYLVNLTHVRRIEGYEVFVGKEKLQISQPRRKEFVHAFLDYSEGNR